MPASNGEPRLRDVTNDDLAHMAAVLACVEDDALALQVADRHRLRCALAELRAFRLTPGDLIPRAHVARYVDEGRWECRCGFFAGRSAREAEETMPPHRAEQHVKVGVL